MRNPRTFRRHVVVCCSAILCAAVGCGPASDGPSVTDEPASPDPAMVLLDSIPKLMQRAEVPGLQLAYMDEGSVVMTAAFGYANSENETPVTDRTVFEAASLSKPVFAYAVLRWWTAVNGTSTSPCGTSSSTSAWRTTIGRRN